MKRKSSSVKLWVIVSVFALIGMLVMSQEDGGGFAFYLVLFLVGIVGISVSIKHRKNHPEHNMEGKTIQQTTTQEGLRSEMPMGAGYKMVIETSETSEDEEEAKVHIEYINAKAKYPKDFTVIDFETTGLDPMEDEIIQAAAVKYRGLQEVDKYITYVNPGTFIPARITELTGITQADVKDAPSMANVLPGFLDFCGHDVLVAHNAKFDISFLAAAMIKNNFMLPDFKVVDTVKMAKKYIKELVNYKLPTLKKHLGLKTGSHQADEDCTTCGALYIYCYNKAYEK